MPPVVAVITALEVAYGLACAVAIWHPEAPMWLRWPFALWDWIADGPAPRPRPNYARIAYLERELGLTGPVAPSLIRQAGIAADEAPAEVGRLGDAIRGVAETER